MAMIGWLVVFVALVGIEVGTMALTTIWFAGGALAAFFMALAGLSFQVQMTVFLAVSFSRRSPGNRGRCGGKGVEKPEKICYTG